MIRGPEEIEKNNFGGPSPGKKLERLSRGKNKFIFEFFSPPRSLMVDPLVCLIIGPSWPLYSIQLPLQSNYPSRTYWGEAVLEARRQ